MAATVYLESLIALGMRERSDEIMVIFAIYSVTTAFAHGYANICLRQCITVVDAIADSFL